MMMKKIKKYMHEGLDGERTKNLALQVQGFFDNVGDDAIF